MTKKLLFVALVATSILNMNAETTDSPLVTGVEISVDGQEPALNPDWEDGDDESNKYLNGTYSIEIDSNINLTFENYDADELTKTLGYHPYIMLATGSGFAINTTFYALDNYMVNDDASVYAFPMDKAKWGDPYMGAYYATPMVCFLKRTGGELPEVITQQDMAEDDDLAESIEFYAYGGSSVFFEGSTYTTQNTSVATLVSVYPNNDWSGETFAQAYSHGTIRFTFTNEISIEEGDIIGEINYTRFDGDDVDLVDIEVGVNAEAGWNPMDGYYTITVDYALDDVKASEISEIEIYLYTMASPYGDVDIEPVVLENDSAEAQRIVKISTASLEDIVVSTENATVYDIAGTLIKENVSLSEVNQLPKGLYIVNGKKVVVK